MSTLTALVAAELRAEQGRQRLTGRDLAARTQAPVTTVARWLKGESRLDIDALGALAEALGYSPEEFIRRALRANGGVSRLPQLDSNQQPAGYAAAEYAVWGMAA